MQLMANFCGRGCMQAVMPYHHVLLLLRCLVAGALLLPPQLLEPRCAPPASSLGEGTHHCRSCQRGRQRVEGWAGIRTGAQRAADATDRQRQGLQAHARCSAAKAHMTCISVIIIFAVINTIVVIFPLCHDWHTSNIP